MFHIEWIFVTPLTSQRGIIPGFSDVVLKETIQMWFEKLAVKYAMLDALGLQVLIGFPFINLNSWSGFLCQMKQRLDTCLSQSFWFDCFSNLTN